jgi:hypothetical protein
MGPRSKKGESRQPLCGFRELQLQGIPRRPVMNPFRPSPDEMAFPISKCRCHQFCLLNPSLNRRHPSKRVADLCLDLLLALGHLLDLQVCFPLGQYKVMIPSRDLGSRTGRQRLLELLGLLGVLQGQGVQVLRASDLELDQGALLVLLDPGGCRISCIVR